MNTDEHGWFVHEMAMAAMGTTNPFAKLICVHPWFLRPSKDPEVLK